jgi:hypothetical protein
MLQRVLTNAQETIKTPKEPQNHLEFIDILNSSLESQISIYVIGSFQKLFLDNENFGYKRSIIITVNIFSSFNNAKANFHGYLTQPLNMPLGPADFVAGSNLKYSNLPKNFFFSKYNNDQIGNMSFDRKFGIWENDPTKHVFFIRGNCVVIVSSPFIGFRYGIDKISIEQVCDPDPREVAWRIDQHLKGDPLEKLSNEEKQKLKTLKITLPKDTVFEQGKEYPFDFPRKLPDGTVPAEIRLVVSRGEIQQIIETNTTNNENVFPNPASLAPDINGQYTVFFGQPDKQTIHCYHINEEGQCLAWGETEVFVKKTENSK